MSRRWDFIELLVRRLRPSFQCGQRAGSRESRMVHRVRCAEVCRLELGLEIDSASSRFDRSRLGTKYLVDFEVCRSKP